jgi:hypothetical protein
MYKSVNANVGYHKLTNRVPITSSNFHRMWSFEQTNVISSATKRMLRVALQEILRIELCFHSKEVIPILPCI